MSQPITVDILSDDDDDDDEPQNNAVSIPRSPLSKRQRIETFSNPTILLIEDDPTPNKAIVPSFTPLSSSSIVAETPMLDFSNPDVAIVKRSRQKGLSDPQNCSDFSNRDVAIVKCNSKGLSDPQKVSGAVVPTFTPSIVAENPMLEFSCSDGDIVKCNSKGLKNRQKFSGTIVPISTASAVVETPMLDLSTPDVGIVECNSQGLSDPQKLSVQTLTPSIVAEAPMLDFSNSNVSIVKRNSKGLSDPQKFSGICGLICLESDNESGHENWEQNDTLGGDCDVGTDSELSSSLAGSEFSPEDMSGDSSLSTSFEDGSTQGNDTQAEEIDSLEPKENILKRKSRSKVNADEENDVNEGNKKRKKTKEEKLWLKEEKNQLREREKLQKTAMKAEAARNRLKEENNQLREREKSQKETRKAEATELKTKKAEAVELKNHLLKEEKKQLREREKLQKAAMKAEAAKNRLKEEKNRLREREKSQKEALKAESAELKTKKAEAAELQKLLLKEEKKKQREREKSQKAAVKAEAAELKKQEKERQKWEKGKFALSSIEAKVDAKVVELGLVGGHLLTRFAEKGLTYRITSNPIEKSILWNMAVPDQISQLSSNSDDIPYVLLVVEAEEFCNLVINETLMEHVSRVQSRYPSHTICYVTNRLMAYIHKREQEQYKNPDKGSTWRRPPVEEVLAKLTTHFVRVHSRQCIDEAEVAEHVVGLTSSLASCRFRKKLTRLSVNANGSLIPKDCIDKDLFKKNSWLKALIAIPKVQPRFALAIRKKFPTMRSLLSVYMDPNKSVHEKEFLLKDLTIEGLLGDDRRLGEVCSKRVYRILTAEYGSSNTDDVEDGADFFSRSLTTPPSRS